VPERRSFSRGQRASVRRSVGARGTDQDRLDPLQVEAIGVYGTTTGRTVWIEPEARHGIGGFLAATRGNGLR